METLERIILQQPVFKGLESQLGAIITGCARNVRFSAGQYILREGEPADEFYLLRAGHVALEVVAPVQAPRAFLTLSAGDILGLSWLVPPYRWGYDALAVEDVRAIAMDARCLRTKCDADHDLGYELMKRFATLLVKRLHDTRLQAFDVYGTPA